MLPNKNGFDVAEEIREVNADTPFIFLTSKTKPKMLLKALKPVAMIMYESRSAWKN